MDSLPTICSYSVTALVPLSPHPSSPTLSFTHGSLRPSYRDLTPYPSRINELGHTLLERALTPPLAPPHPPNPYAGLPKGSIQAEMELYDAGGPLWWRGLAEVEDEKTVCGWASELQQKLGVRRVIGVSRRFRWPCEVLMSIQGHTPNFERIVDRCNASVIIIDTGMSSAYGGVLSALEIVYSLTPHSSEKSHDRQDPFLATPSAIGGLLPGHRYWEREEVHAIYERGRKVITVEERDLVL